MKSNFMQITLKSFSFFIDSGLILNYGLEALNKTVLQNSFIKLIYNNVFNILGGVTHGNFRTNVIKR